LEFAKLLARYGYQTTRQAGSHLRLTSTFGSAENHITIPAHKFLKVGTLDGILGEVATYLNVSRPQLEQELFAS
jgi:predicted RNA binding protein YcfA (HicA-like mRNA interferase family)